VLEAAAAGAVSAAARSLDAALREGGALPGPGLCSAPGSRPATPPGAPPHEASLEKLRDLGRDAAPAGPGGARRPSLPAARAVAQRAAPAAGLCSAADTQARVRRVGRNTTHSSSAGATSRATTLLYAHRRAGAHARPARCQQPGPGQLPPPGEQQPAVVQRGRLRQPRRAAAVPRGAGEAGAPPPRVGCSRSQRAMHASRIAQALFLCDSALCTLPRSGVPRVCDCRLKVCHRRRPLARSPHLQRHGRARCSAPGTVRMGKGQQQHRR